MMRKIFYITLVLSLLAICNVSAFQFFGTVYNITKGPIDNVNVSVSVYVMVPMAPPQLINLYSNLTDANGNFSLQLPDNETYMYLPTVRHFNGDDVDFVGQSLPYLPYMDLFSISPIDFFLKEGATINITAVGDPASAGTTTEIAHHNVADYYLGLEWDNDTGLWAYLNSTWNLIKLNPDFSINAYYAQVDMTDIRDFEYVSSNIWYFINLTDVKKFIDNGTALTLNETFSNLTCMDSNPCNYLFVSSLEHDVGLPGFYVMSVINNGSANVTAMNIFNESFGFVTNELLPDFPPGEITMTEEGALAILNLSGQFVVTKQSGELWNLSASSVEGLEYNGSALFYGSGVSSNITEFELDYTNVKSFNYMVKDVSLGYPIAEEFNNPTTQATVYLPADRTYSIMIYPDMSFPVSFNLDNLSAYPTPKHVDIQFNTSMQWRFVSGTITYNGSGDFIEGGLNIISYLLEPGDMVFQEHPLPSNMGAWRYPSVDDSYDNNTGFYNITLPGAAMGVDILLFAVGEKEGGNFYGAFRNITLEYSDASVENFDFTLYELVGSVEDLNLTEGQPRAISIRRANIQINNASGSAITSNAHVETLVDYSSLYSEGPEFSWMDDISNDDGGVFEIPLLSGAGIKRMNIFSQQFAPQKKSFSAALVETGSFEINLSQFEPKNPNGSEAFTDIIMDMIKSTPECDVPDFDRANCSLFPQGEEMEIGNFNPFKIVLGGGKISMVMIKQSNNITVHYKNVDMMASGPPDAAFDSDANETEEGSGLDMAWRFGSQGPEIYDEVLIGVPLDQGVDVNAPINVLLSNLYDEDWNPVWNVADNDTAELPEDYEGFDTSWFNASTNGKPCSTTNVSAYCYVNPERKMVWLRIPHFSGIGPTVQTTTIGNLTMTADDDDYVCVSFCTIYFNVTNENYTLSESLHNITVTTLDVNGSAISSVNISWYNGTDYEYNGTDSSTQTDYNLTLYNGTENSAHKYMLNVYKSSIETNLNITYNITDLNMPLTLSVSLYNLNISLMSPSEGNWTTNDQPDFVFNYTYSPSATISCELMIDDVGYGLNWSVVNNTPTTIVANDSLAEGNHSWRIDCAKGGMEVASSLRTINIDTGVPTVNLLNSSFNTTDNTTSITFNFSDSVSSTADCSLYFNDVSVANNGSVQNRTNTVLTSSTEQSDGSYNVYINCTDGGGFVGQSDNITVQIDRTGPTVAITSPEDGEHVYDNTTDIVFSFTDSRPSASCTVVVNNSIYGTNSSVWSSTATTITNSTGLAVGSHSVYINCTDDLGNLGTSSVQSFVVDRTAPTITNISSSDTDSATTTGTATISATTDEDSTCWYNTSDFIAANGTGTMMSGNGTSSHSFTVGYSADGTIGPFYISCRDVAGNNMTSSNTTGSISVSVTEGGGSNGGGGGGGGLGNPSTSQTWIHVTPGAATIMKIASNEFGLKEIIISVSNPVKDMIIRIEKLPGKPAVVTKNITGKVFSYLKINKTHLNDSDLNGSIKIKFQVTQSWLLANKIEAKNMVLKRFNGQAWDDLRTVLLTTDSKYAYYEAETPSLSYFAIAEKGAEPVAVPKPDTTPAEEPKEEPAATPPPAETPAEKPPVTEEKPPVEKQGGMNAGLQILIVVVIIAAIALVLISTLKKRKGGLKPVREMKG